MCVIADFSDSLGTDFFAILNKKVIRTTSNASQSLLLF